MRASLLIGLAIAMLDVVGCDVPPLPVFTDGGASDGQDSDATQGCDYPTPSGYCCVSRPFGPPTRVSALNLIDDGSLRLSTAPAGGGGVVGVFNSTSRTGSVGGRQEIWQTTFDGTTFSSPHNLMSVNSTSAQFSPSLSANGLTLVFNSDNTYGFNNFHFWTTTRTSVDLPFPTPGPFAAANDLSVDRDIDPYLIDATSGRVMYFGSNRRGSQGVDIFRMSQNGSAWTTPILLGPLQGSGYDTQPAVTPDEDVIYFASDRNGQIRIFVATRPVSAAVGTFDSASIREVTELTAGGLQQSPSYISADRCTIYFTRQIAVNLNPTEIWTATRTP